MMDTHAKAKTTETNFHGRRSSPSLRWWIGALILADSKKDEAPTKTSLRRRDLPKLPQTWGTIIARSFKALGVFGGFGVASLIPAILTMNLYLLTLLLALATFSHASFATIANVLPSDLYKNASAATVSGSSGTGPPPGHDHRFRIGRPSFRWAYLDSGGLVRPAHGYRGADSL